MTERVRVLSTVCYVFVGAVCTMCTLGGLSLLTTAYLRILRTCVWISMCICICVHFIYIFISCIMYLILFYSVTQMRLTFVNKILLTYLLTELWVLFCLCYRMAPEVIACDEDPDATYDNRVSVISLLCYVICNRFIRISCRNCVANFRSIELLKVLLI